MTPKEFYQTIYLGDRWCKQVTIDGVAREIKLQVDLISRVRGERWDYYADEDLSEGFIVLESVDRFEFLPQGPLPNDWIEFVSISEIDSDGNYKFEISLGSSSTETAQAEEIMLTIFAKQLCLADSEGRKVRL